MWGAFRDHATPFQSRATTGNETLPDAQGLLDNKYIHAFMYISDTDLTRSAKRTCEVPPLRFVTCTRCDNQRCINKSENAAKQSY